MERVDKKHWLYTQKIAHRGLHDMDYPENTIPALRKAVEQGYAIETDIHVTSDHRIVVFHDDILKRATGGRDVRRIETLTYREIKETKIFGCDYHAPLFEELLEAVDGKVPLLIEYKKKFSTDNRLEELSAKILDGYNGAFAIQSFNPFIVKWFKKNRPDVLRGQLAGYFEGEDLGGIQKFVLKRMSFNRKNLPDFISYDIRNLPNKYVNQYLKKHDVPILGWTVRSQTEYEKIAPFVQNIIFENFIPKDV